MRKPLDEALTDHLLAMAAKHIQDSAPRNARFLEAVKRVDEMEMKIALARLIRDIWGPMTYMIEEEGV